RRGRPRPTPSCRPPPRREAIEPGLDPLLSVHDFHLHARHQDARIARKLRWQADRVLLGAEDVRGASARKAREDLLELPPRKSMVVGKERLVHDLCAERARGLTKGIRPRQASDEEDARA